MHAPSVRWESDWSPRSPRRWFDREAERENLPLLAPRTRWVGRRYLETVSEHRIERLNDIGDRSVEDVDGGIDVGAPTPLVASPFGGVEILMPDLVPLDAEEEAMLRRRARRILGYQLRRYVMMRAIALHWLERTQRTLCAPDGTGRAADALAFEAEFAR